MFIKTQGENKLVNTDKATLIYVSRYEGSNQNWFVRVSFDGNCDRIPKTRLGEYSTKEDADEVFKRLTEAMSDNKQVFEMPEKQ